ncbi:MAG: hypothetical protein QXW10_02695, partial [Candidatus Micrarchaeaceae archaeon]
AVRFNISSASITIGNVTYPVAIADGMVNATISTHMKLNSSSDLMVDLSPIVIPTYNNGSYGFALVPFLNAAFGTNPEHSMVTSSLIQDGMHAQVLDNRYMMRNNPFYKAVNISVRGSSFNIRGNETLFNISLGNMGSSAITVYGIIVEGDTAGLAIGEYGGMRGIDWSNAYNESNGSVVINASAMYIDGYGMNGNGPERIMLPHPANMIIITGGMGGHGDFNSFARWRMQMPKCIDFAVESNGTLSAFPTPFFIYNGSIKIGYVLQPFSNKTFVYEGSAANSFSNGTYEILVLTNKGITTASSNGSISK